MQDIRTQRAPPVVGQTSDTHGDHSMQQAANLGDRLIMMHRGRIIQDFHGAES